MGNCCRSIGARRRRHSLEFESSKYLISSSAQYKTFTAAAEDVQLYYRDIDDIDIDPYGRASRHLRSLETVPYEPWTSSPVSYAQIEPLLQPWTSSPYGCASFDVTNKATTIEWKGYGLKIQILDDSIPHYLTVARLDVSVHYFNNQEYLPIPRGHRDPISALYSIKVGSGKLCKPVTIEIQHCHMLSTLASEIPFSLPEMTLLRASNEREYFRPVMDVVFDQRTNCGRVTVPKLDQEEYNDFSWFIIAIRWVFFP